MTVCSYFVQCHDQASFRLRLYPLKRLLSSKFCRPQPFQPNFSATCGACEELLSEHDIDRNLNISSCVTCGVGICYSKTVLALWPTVPVRLDLFPASTHLNKARNLSRISGTMVLHDTCLSEPLYDMHVRLHDPCPFARTWR